jgi:hypothetical protein
MSISVHVYMRLRPECRDLIPLLNYMIRSSLLACEVHQTGSTRHIQVNALHCVDLHGSLHGMYYSVQKRRGGLGFPRSGP